MPEISFEYLKNTAFLGGLGTGCLKLSADGGTHFSGLVKTSKRRTKLTESAFPVSFALSVSTDGETKPHFFRLCNPEADAAPENRASFARLLSFDKQFPFTAVEYDTAPSGVSVHLNAFNPAIAHNPIDSGIPAAFFEFTVQNNTQSTLTVSLGTLLHSFFSAGKIIPGYDAANGAFYAEIAETARNIPIHRRGSLCLATDSPDFTYDADFSASDSDSTNAGDAATSTLAECGDFFARFCKNRGFLSNKSAAAAQKNASIALSCHLRLSPGKAETVRFLVAWNFPFCADSVDKNGDKNYYCHYFSDIPGCISYCFTHFERLRRESRRLYEYLFEHTALPDALKSLVNISLSCIKDPAVRRDHTGALRGAAEDDEENGSPPLFFAAEYVFPGITALGTTSALKKLLYAKGKSTESDDFAPSAYDTDCTPRQILTRHFMLLRLYYIYRTRSDMRFLSENWVDIAYMAEVLSESADAVESSNALSFRIRAAQLCLYAAMTEAADQLGDKKRKMFFIECFRTHSESFNAAALRQITLAPATILSTQFIAHTLCGLSLYPKALLEQAADRLSDGESPDADMDFFACAELAVLKRSALCLQFSQAAAKARQCNKPALFYAATQVCALLPAFCGFDYDKNTMTLTLSPVESHVDDEGTFRAFVSFDGAYGHAEQGADYIELKLLAGEVKIRRFICSHRPYKVLYGGRLWPCDIDPATNTVTLDNNLTVTKDKKLTLLIDLTK